MITNKTKGTIIATDVSFANTAFKRMQGLLGRKTFAVGQSLVIQPCNSIHTCFMRFAIDILFVSKDNQVIQAIKHLPPFRFSPLCFRSRFVIELPPGTIQATSTNPGDYLSLS